MWVIIARRFTVFGTYSMKLLGEKYLKGSMDFSTSVENGTEFRFSLPTCECQVH